MNYSCGNCKHLKRDDRYLYPYKCRFNKEERFSCVEIDHRIENGYKCEKYELDVGEKYEER